MLLSSARVRVTTGDIAVICAFRMQVTTNHKLAPHACTCSVLLAYRAPDIILSTCFVFAVFAVCGGYLFCSIVGDCLDTAL